MIEQEQHEMILEKTHPSGADEWYCPICGRRLLMDYEPRYKKTVLEAGDEFAIHSGGKGGLRVGSIQAKPVDRSVSQMETDDMRLAPWTAWLDEVDFESLWNKTD
jgi:hypothetical protein